MDAVDIGPLGRLVGAEVVVRTERFPEPLVQPRIPVPGRKHLSNQSPVKVPRHGLQKTLRLMMHFRLVHRSK